MVGAPRTPPCHERSQCFLSLRPPEVPTKRFEVCYCFLGRPALLCCSEALTTPDVVVPVGAGTPAALSRAGLCLLPFLTWATHQRALVVVPLPFMAVGIGQASQTNSQVVMGSSSLPRVGEQASYRHIQILLMAAERRKLLIPFHTHHVICFSEFSYFSACIVKFFPCVPKWFICWFL